MAIFALWFITGMLCVMSQLQATDVADHFDDERVALIAVFGMSLFVPMVALGFATYASMRWF